MESPTAQLRAALRARSLAADNKWRRDIASLALLSVGRPTGVWLLASALLWPLWRQSNVGANLHISARAAKPKLEPELQLKASRARFGQVSGWGGGSGARKAARDKVRRGDLLAVTACANRRREERRRRSLPALGAAWCQLARVGAAYCGPKCASNICPAASCRRRPSGAIKGRLETRQPIDRLLICFPLLYHLVFVQCKWWPAWRRLYSPLVASSCF